MNASDADRVSSADGNLLFGLLALQNGRVTREGLLDGMQAFLLEGEITGNLDHVLARLATTPAVIQR